MTDGKMLFGYDRKRTSTLTLDSQPGAHTGATRKYIPGYSDSNIVFLNTSTGNDANTGASIAQAVLTYAQAATLAGTTKKIRLVNSATLTSNITKPTEATIGTTSTIASASMTAPVDTWTQAGTPSFGVSTPKRVKWFPHISKFIAVGDGGKIGLSPDGDTYTQAATPSFSTSDIYDLIYVPSMRTFCAVGASSKSATSTNGTAWTQQGSVDAYRIAWAESFGYAISVNQSGTIRRSYDLETWDAFNAALPQADTTLALAWIPELSKFFMGGVAAIYHSADGANWTKVTTPNVTGDVREFVYCPEISTLLVISLDGMAYSTDSGVTWTATGTVGMSGEEVLSGEWVPELARAVVVGGGGKMAYSNASDLATFTAVGTPSFSTSAIYGVAYSPLLGKLAACSDGASGKLAYSTAYGTTISASVAGFSIQAVQYSGTVTAYNCTLKQPGTTAALSLDSCRVTESGSHISNNAVTSIGTLYEGDRHTTCTPASQNAIDMNLDTVGGTWYIYNASATAYERIRDCLVEGGIVANYNVTVSGRANVRGTSSNVLFGATVTHRDPKFIDTTDYKLQFQSNGYARNSLAAGRSALYFNSSGDARDIGAWSYVESSVSHYFAKNVYLQKGEITHSVEEVVSEQQGDSGAVSVYGNVNRIKEVITIKYNTEAEADFAVIRAMRLLTDKTVLIQLDPEWSANAGTVVANGAHSAGADVLNIDSTATYNGMTVTISGKTYYPLRAEPSLTATTRLILDRPLEDAVADNDVITRNYPSGTGEYQYAAQSRLDLNRVDPTVMRGYRSGFIIRLVRAYQ